MEQLADIAAADRERAQPGIAGDPASRLWGDALWGTLPRLWACRACLLLGRHDVPQRIWEPASGEVRTVQITPRVVHFLGVDNEALLEAQFAAIERLQQGLVAEPLRGGVLHENLRLIGQHVGLEPASLQLLMLRVVHRLEPGFAEALNPLLCDCIDPLFSDRLDRVLGVAPGTCERLLEPDGALARSGLLRWRLGVGTPLEARLQLPQGLMGGLLQPLSSGQELVRRLVKRARPSTLALTDFAHLAAPISLILQRLKGALQRGSASANVLLHGIPGTGKTELAALLAQVLGVPLYAIEACDNRRDDQLKPDARLTEYRFAQGIVRMAGPALILLDEVEDLFPVPWHNQEHVPSKALINETLERSTIPALWLTNRVDHIDPAFLRRFDVILEVTPPDRRHKVKVLRDHLPATADIDPAWLSRAVAPRALTPGVLARIGRTLADAEISAPAQMQDAVDRMRREYVRAAQGEDLPPLMRAADGMRYATRWLNTDAPVDHLLERLRERPVGRLLFHGPPGTGKTALAHHIAEHISQVLMVKRASDLLSPYVGETEARLAAAFREAGREGDVLLIDEADSFLGDRRGTRARWEATQTNELLTQMEAFEGLLICTTNRLEELDPAVLRRFDLKIGFVALSAAQRRALIEDVARSAGMAWTPAAEAAVHGAQSRLSGLTPGDVAAALRHLALTTTAATVAELLAALESECSYKAPPARAIGFIA